MILLYLILIICVIIWLKFGQSLESVQYYHNKLLKSFDWSELEGLKYCIYSSILYSGSYLDTNEKIFKLYGPNYTRHFQPIGLISRKKDNYLIIALKSTANLNDVLVSVNHQLIDIPEGQIHQGYYENALEILPSILNIIRYFPEKELFLTGHSMGGSLVSIVGYLIKKFIKGYKIRIETYGSPKYGNIQLKSYMEKRLEITNYVNEADLVIQKPLDKRYTRIGKVIKHRIDTGNDNVNHGIKVYRECVLKVKESKIPKRGHRFDEIVSRFFFDILG